MSALRKRATRSYEDLTPRQRHRQMVRTLIRPFVLAVVLVVLYYRLPLTRSFDVNTVVALVIGLLAVAGAVVLQVTMIMNSAYPRLRAVGALATTIPLFLVLFATTYYLINNGQAHSFTEPITRTDSLYFTVTVFSTVGFGDIAPVAESARIVTMIQMFGDLLLFGIIGKVVLGAVNVSLQRRSTAAVAPDSPSAAPTAE